MNKTNIHELSFDEERHPDIRVIFDIDINGILDVYARGGNSHGNSNMIPCVLKESRRLTVLKTNLMGGTTMF